MMMIARSGINWCNKVRIVAVWNTLLFTAVFTRGFNLLQPLSGRLSRANLRIHRIRPNFHQGLINYRAAVHCSVAAQQQDGDHHISQHASSVIESEKKPPVATKIELADNAARKPSEIELMEIRVGRIVSIAKHPEADSLYVEKVDLGEADGPRTIVSGLVEYCSEEYLLNKVYLRC